MTRQAAAVTAWSTSAASPNGASAMTSAVDGFSTGATRPESELTHSPPTRFLSFTTPSATGAL